MPDLPVPPAVVLSLLLATALAAGFHLVFGGSARRLLLYVLAAWAGFAAGQWAGGKLPVSLLEIGSVHVVVAGIVCLLTLVLTRWLAMLPPAEAQE